MDILAKNGAITRDQYANLAGKSGYAPRPALASQEDIQRQVKEQVDQEVKKQVAEATQDVPEITLKDKLQFESKDGNFKWKIGGRIHTQAGVYNNSHTDDGESTGFKSGASIRRARLNVSAKLWKVWGLKLQYDFAGGSGTAGLRDAWIDYTNKEIWPFQAMVGQFKEYISLESFGSSNDITFIERALPTRAFMPPDARRLGFGLRTYGHDLWTLSTGVYGRNASGEDFGGVDIGSSNPMDFVGRVTVSPIHTDTEVVHLGFGGSYLSPDYDIRFRERPEMTPGTNRLVDTGLIEDVRGVTRLNAEVAGMYGPFSLQGEYWNVNLDRKGNADATFDGWYLQGSWIITGESRHYKWKDGTFHNPKPEGIVGDGGWGAWELGARYSTLDLNSGAIHGGSEDNFTVGVNWYPTPIFKFMANYVKVLNVDGGQYAGASPDGFLFRGQVAW